jgi:hypothetical protein
VNLRSNAATARELFGGVLKGAAHLALMFLPSCWVIFSL